MKSPKSLRTSWRLPPSTLPLPPPPLEGGAQAKADSGRWGLDCKLVPSSGHRGRGGEGTGHRRMGEGESGGGRQRSSGQGTDRGRWRREKVGRGGSCRRGRPWEHPRVLASTISRHAPSIALDGHVSRPEPHQVVCDQGCTQPQSSSRVGNSRTHRFAMIFSASSFGGP